MSATARRRLGALAAAGPLVFAVAWAISGALQTGYDPLRDDESSLAAIGAAHPWITITGDVLLGGATLALAAGLFTAPAGRHVTVACSLVLAAGLAIIVQALAREDCLTQFAACAGTHAGRASWHQALHNTAAGLAFILLAVAPLVSPARFALIPTGSTSLPTALLRPPSACRHCSPTSPSPTPRRAASASSSHSAHRSSGSPPSACISAGHAGEPDRDDQAARSGAAAHALSAVAGIVALCTLCALGACGGEDGTTATTSATPHAAAAKVAPYPTDDERPVESGVTYTTTRFRPHLAMTVTPGVWIAETGDRPDHVSIARDIARGQALLAFHHMTRVFDPRRGGKTPGDQIAGPSDFSAWLLAHPHLRATRPNLHRAARHARRDDRGHDHVVGEHTPDACAKFAAPACIALFHDGFDYAVYPTDSRTRFYVLGKPGAQLVVEEWVEPKAQFAHQIRVLERELRATRLALP